MLDTVVMSGDDVCCSVVFGTLVGVFVFSVMWSELLMTSAISCPLWSSVYECQRVECAFTSLLSVMLSIAVLTNEVCTAWSDSFLVLASNGTTVWLCLVKSVSFISLGGVTRVCC